MRSRRAPAAQLPAALQPGVQPLEKLGVEPARLHVTEARLDVQPVEVLVPLTSRDLEIRDLQPLRDRLADGDRRLRMPPFVHTVLQSSQGLGSLSSGVDGLRDLPALAGQGVGARVDDHSQASGGQLFDGPRLRRDDVMR
jgi:hypothetical protein